MTNIWVMLYYTALGATLFLLLLERRFSLGKTCAIVYGVTLLLMVMDFWIDRLLGFDWLVRLYAPLNHVPIALTMAFVSRNRGWHLVFQLLSTVMLAMLLQHVSALVFLLSGRRSGALLLTYAVLTALLVPYVRYFLRPLYLRIFRQLRRGWGLICLVLAAYYAIVIYLVPGYAGETMWATMFKSAISLLIVGFFSVVLFLFSSIQRETEARHSAELAALQIAGLRSRMDAVREAEEVVRLERHDLRHRLHTAAELVRQGADRGGAEPHRRGPGPSGGEPARPLVPPAGAGRGLFRLLRPGRAAGNPGGGGAYPGRDAAGGRGGAGDGLCQRPGERHPRLPGPAGGGAGAPLQGHQPSRAHAGGSQSLRRAGGL